ncbi:MAG: tol-pal system-associated acyl-CoA thioesterase [Pigmentiphaga sp.]|nr:tol-pal system-associated acyl-CoA thioesterase [Pigmentiphaga sp.]
MPAASSTLPTPFEFSIRVYYEDTDAGGVVYHANYLRFFERARTEWLRALGFGQQAMIHDYDRLFVVRRADTRFQAPARLDDVLRIRSHLTRLGRASLQFRQECHRDDQPLASAVIEVGCLEAQGFRPAALPSPVATILAQLVEPPAGGRPTH